MTEENTYIKVRDLSLVYDLYYDKTNTLKEFFVNTVTGKKYVDKQKAKLNAIDNISFNVNHGERLGIIGLNGAGKSTLLKVMSGILKPTSGTLEVQGRVQPLIEVGAGFNPEFSGRENIYLNGAMLGFNKKQIMEKEDEIIEFSELRDFIDVPVKYYSSGMSVRLGFTVATIIQPEILLMDEMLSAGDVSFISKAQRRLKELLNIAKILVLVSHNLDLIQKMTPRTIVLNHGKIIFDGETEKALKLYKELFGQ